jgi:hypothetical protein
MKRTLVYLLTSAAVLIAGTAVAEPSGDPFEGKTRPVSSEQTMSGDEVMRYALPYLPRIAQCYRRHALPDRRATGDLELYLVIARTGKVVHSEVTAPGVMMLRFAYLERCVKREVATWRFPMRKGFTNAVIPYFFLHTNAPGAGPRVAPRLR